jgi:hypothetical protein
MKTFGFPSFYGRNLNAWIDCMSDLRDDTGMTTILLAPREVLKIELVDTDGLRHRCPAVLDMLVDGCNDVNQRFVAASQLPAIELVFY